ncbi:hypothetical protein CERZMDRAFT_53642 [Cercospora zeae-maydis SCOH1-5]|uniref:Uncharacterized protein n=1 Tax=Cercospora zeae-maydis SCOH1-5 TaxID=717836 RepID=A0A6A6EYN3_9PEZI|nr:hypothetical protein CERZMDRAFT_53642 [Cercospora zeae-maydis SCOH1-5]
MLGALLLVAAALAGHVAAAGADAESVPLFIDNMNPNAQWAASIQNACNGSTTYVVSMTSAPFGNAGQVATITEGKDFFQVTSAAIYSETSATMHESCALDPAKASASCIVTVVDDNYGPTPLSKTISYNLTGTAYYVYGVAITAGVKHTASGGACLAKVNGAGSHSTSGSADVIILGSLLAIGVTGLLWM